jgi:putative PIN family toxin of toxin-antitoxin system
MIVVLDTNVMISALLSPRGTPAKIMEYWETEAFEVAISQPLLDEFERALGYERVKRYFKRPQEKINALLKRLKTVGISVDPQVELNVIEADPDNRVSLCALAANATYIITGDEHLLALEEYQGVMIIPPVGFLALLNL